MYLLKYGINKANTNIHSIAVILLESSGAHLQCSKVTKFEPARSCQSLLLSDTDTYSRRRVWKLVSESTHRRTWHAGLGVMWCEINGGGVRKKGGRREEEGRQRSEDNRGRGRKEHMHYSTGSHSSGLPPDLQVWAVYHLRENTASPSQHTNSNAQHTPPPSSASQHPEQLSATSGPSGGRVCVCACVCTVTSCHASTVC